MAAQLLVRHMNHGCTTTGKTHDPWLQNYWSQTHNHGCKITSQTNGHGCTITGQTLWLHNNHTCDISLFRRELPIFCLFLRKSPYENFQNFLYILYISLFGISDLPTKIQELPSLFNHSPYLEKKISLFVFWDVSHV